MTISNLMKAAENSQEANVLVLLKVWIVWKRIRFDGD